MAPAACTRAPQLHYVHSALLHSPQGEPGALKQPAKKRAARPAKLGASRLSATPVGTNGAAAAAAAAAAGAAVRVLGVLVLGGRGAARRTARLRAILRLLLLLLLRLGTGCASSSGGLLILFRLGRAAGGGAGERAALPRAGAARHHGGEATHAADVQRAGSSAPAPAQTLSRAIEIYGQRGASLALRRLRRAPAPICQPRLSRCRAGSADSQGHRPGTGCNPRATTRGGSSAPTAAAARGEADWTRSAGCVRCCRRRRRRTCSKLGRRGLLSARPIFAGGRSTSDKRTGSQEVVWEG